MRLLNNVKDYHRLINPTPTETHEERDKIGGTKFSILKDNNHNPTMKYDRKQYNNKKLVSLR